VELLFINNTSADYLAGATLNFVIFNAYALQILREQLLREVEQ